MKKEESSGTSGPQQHHIHILLTTTSAISAHRPRNHIQVPQAPLLHHPARIPRRPHIRPQDPNRRTAPRAPRRGAAPPPEGQSARGRQAAQGVQRPGRRHHQPDGEAGRRVGPRQRTAAAAAAALAVAVWGGSAGDAVAEPRPSGQGKETGPHPHPLRRPLPHPVLAPGKAPGYPARRRRWLYQYALRRPAGRVFSHSAIHVPHRRVSAGVLAETLDFPEVRQLPRLL